MQRGHYEQVTDADDYARTLRILINRRGVGSAAYDRRMRWCLQ
jgi:hypothetical protein